MRPVVCSLVQSYTSSSKCSNRFSVSQRTSVQSTQFLITGVSVEKLILRKFAKLKSPKRSSRIARHFVSHDFWPFASKQDFFNRHRRLHNHALFFAGNRVNAIKRLTTVVDF